MPFIDVGPIEGKSSPFAMFGKGAGAGFAGGVERGLQQKDIIAKEKRQAQYGAFDAAIKMYYGLKSPEAKRQFVQSSPGWNQKIVPMAEEIGFPLVSNEDDVMVPPEQLPTMEEFARKETEAAGGPIEREARATKELGKVGAEVPLTKPQQAELDLQRDQYLQGQHEFREMMDWRWAQDDKKRKSALIKMGKEQGDRIEFLWGNFDKTFNAAAKSLADPLKMAADTTQPIVSDLLSSYSSLVKMLPRTWDEKSKSNVMTQESLQVWSAANRRTMDFTVDQLLSSFKQGSKAPEYQEQFLQVLNTTWKNEALLQLLGGEDDEGFTRYMNMISNVLDPRDSEQNPVGQITRVSSEQDPIGQWIVAPKRPGFFGKAWGKITGGGYAR